MASPVDVANMALQIIGASPITALDDGSKSASYVNQFYETNRDATLQAFEWNFAITRQALSKLSSAPLYTWSYAYQLPTDPYCLRILELDQNYAYVIEGRSLLTNLDAAKARYIGRVTDLSVWHPLAIKLLAASIALDIAYPLTEQASAVKLAQEAFARTQAEARSIDSQEQHPQTYDTEESLVLLNVRRSGYVRVDTNLR